MSPVKTLPIILQTPAVVTSVPGGAAGCSGCHFDSSGFDCAGVNCTGIVYKPVAQKPSADPVSHPPHYTQGSVECIDAIEAMLGPAGFISFLQGQVMKYTWRLEHKGNSVQDIKKALWYAERLKLRLIIAHMETL